jgi:hypothetical protein
VKVEVSSVANDFGRVRGGRIRIPGPICPFSVTLVRSGDEPYIETSIPNTGFVMGIQDKSLPGLDAVGSSTKFYLLGIKQKKDKEEIPMRSVILYRMVITPGEYERVGMWKT